MTHSAYGRAELPAPPKNSSTIEAAQRVARGRRGQLAEVTHVTSESSEGEAYWNLSAEVLGSGHASEPARLHAPHVVVPPRHWLSRAGKRLLDTLGAIGLALIFLPLMICVVLILRRDGGPVIYKHRRVGKHGEIFECLKFRTMVPDADRILHKLLATDDGLKAEWIQNHKLKDDPRVTAIGRFLRQTSLDELPQLWNVLRGEMSLVGPRPVVREELLRYGRSAGLYLSVRPGITGLWQAMGRNDTDYRRRVAMDVYYVRNHSVWLDAYILMKTTGVVVGRHGAY